MSPSEKGGAQFRMNFLRHRGVFLGAILAAVYLVFITFPGRIGDYWATDAMPPVHYSHSNQPALGNIPKHIWQIFFYDEAKEDVMDKINSWLWKHPDFTYTRLGKPGGLEFVNQNFQHRPDLIRLYSELTLPMLKGDLLRYMILVAQGGVYADMDVSAAQPLKKWIPKEYRNQVRAVVGMEYDRLDSPEIGVGYFMDVQFASWSLAAAPNHPMFELAVDSIASRIYALAGKENLPLSDLEPTDDEILQTTGPAAWTSVVFESLSIAAGRPIGPPDLTGLDEPTLFGDILVLPIDGFATNLGHSGAGKHPDQAMTIHGFHGSWRGSGEKGYSD